MQIYASYARNMLFFFITIKPYLNAITSCSPLASVHARRIGARSRTYCLLCVFGYDLVSLWFVFIFRAHPPSIKRQRNSSPNVWELFHSPNDRLEMTWKWKRLGNRSRSVFWRPKISAVTVRRRAPVTGLLILCLNTYGSVCEATDTRLHTSTRFRRCLEPRGSNRDVAWRSSTRPKYPMKLFRDENRGGGE